LNTTTLKFETLVICHKSEQVITVLASLLAHFHMELAPEVGHIKHDAVLLISLSGGTSWLAR
jgi:hypothetical protein